MPSKDEPLTCNGVVYNEMKGAFSSPEGVLDRVVLNYICFRIHPYANESGGDPDVIPELTYEQFLGFPQNLLSSVQQLYLSVWKYGYGREAELAG